MIELNDDPTRAPVNGRPKCGEGDVTNKQKEAFEEAKFRYVLFDNDAVETAAVTTAFDAREISSEKEPFEFFTERFNALFGSELNDRDYVAVPTSSSRFFNPGRISFRTVFELAIPLTEAQYKHWASLHDKRLRDMGFTPAPGKKAIIDSGVYTRGRHFFTSAPMIFVEFRNGGRVENRLELATGGASAIFVEREYAQVTPPPDVLAVTSETSTSVGYRRSGDGASADCRPVGKLENLADGNTNEILPAWVWNYCCKTPKRFWNAAWVAETIRQAMLARGMEPDQGDRKRFTTVEGIDKDFERLWHKVPGVTYSDAAPLPELPTVLEARRQLDSLMREDLSRSIGSKEPALYIHRMLPGLGKNYALHNNLPVDHLRNYSNRLLRAHH